MKKNISLYKINKIILMLGVGALSFACTGDFNEINSSGGPTEEEANGDFFHIGVHLQSLQTNVIVVSTVNAYQFNENLTGQPYARYLSITKDAWNTENFCVFNAPINWVNEMYITPMSRLYSSWFELKKILEKSNMTQHFSWAWAELLRVAAVHRITDMFGPIPYSQIKNNKGSLYVPYDTQQEVYAGMLEDLNKAIDILTNYVQSGGASEWSALKAYDIVYAGDFNKWVKFANSLKLRMAMRMAFADPINAKRYALEALNHPIGVITSNNDNAFITNGTNPIFIMYGAYADTRAAAELMTYLKGFSDPRLNSYFVPAVDGNVQRGIRVGIRIPSHDWACKNFSTPRVNEKDPLLWMCAAEIAFLKAEIASYWGWTTDNAEALYNEGIRLSFEQWGAGDATAYLNDATSKQASYSDDSNNTAAAVSTITIKWDDAATKEVKLERIITQKWIAIYPLGHEAWAEQRRTGYPRFFTIPVVNNIDQTLKTRGASRIPFGQGETQNNAENLQNALNRDLGGRNEYGIRLWWDAKTGKPGW